LDLPTDEFAGHPAIARLDPADTRDSAKRREWPRVPRRAGAGEHDEHQSRDRPSEQADEHAEAPTAPLARALAARVRGLRRSASLSPPLAATSCRCGLLAAASAGCPRQESNLRTRFRNARRIQYNSI